MTQDEYTKAVASIKMNKPYALDDIKAYTRNDISQLECVTEYGSFKLKNGHCVNPSGFFVDQLIPTCFQVSGISPAKWSDTLLVEHSDSEWYSALPTHLELYPEKGFFFVRLVCSELAINTITKMTINLGGQLVQSTPTTTESKYQWHNYIP